MEYLEQLHKTEVEILDEIVRICQKHNLRYYLIGGTLLGAVRHKGFIPWDDDLDIVMPRNDYDRFCELCKTELNEGYYLHDINYDNKYWLIFAKIRKKNTIFDEKNVSTIDAPKGIYVDIFPLDNAPCEDSKKQRNLTRRIKMLSTVIYIKRKINVKFRLRAKLFALLFAPFSIKSLTKHQLKLMTKYNGDSSCEYYINYGSNYNTVKQTIHKSKFEPSSKVEFEGKMYNTLGDPHYFLNRLYGESYMELPPEEKRVTHRPVRVSFDTTVDEEEK